MSLDALHFGSTCSLTALQPIVVEPSPVRSLAADYPIHSFLTQRLGVFHPSALVNGSKGFPAIQRDTPCPFGTWRTMCANAHLIIFVYFLSIIKRYLYLPFRRSATQRQKKYPRAYHVHHSVQRPQQPRPLTSCQCPSKSYPQRN